MAKEPELASWEGQRDRGKRKPAHREARTGRRGKRWLVVGGIVVVLLVVLVALAPMIGGRVAPGIVSDSLSQDIEGEVRVDAISLNWFGNTRLRDVTLLDPDGGKVATLSLDVPVSVWRALSEGWWDRRHLELGRIVVTGDATIVREADGSTNLMRAIKPVGPDEPSKRDAFEGVLVLDGVDVTVAAREADGTIETGTRSDLRDVKGEVAFDYDTRRGTQIAASGNLEAALGGEAAEAGRAMALTVNLDGNISAAGSLLKSTGTVQASTVPVAVLDVLGGFNGALREAVGPAAAAQVNFSGDLRAGELQLTLDSEGASADLNARLIDGVLAVQEGAQIRLASTDGLERLPAVAAAFARAGERVRINEAPGATVTIRSTRIPVGPLLEGDASPAELDLRGASFDLSIEIEQMAGEILLVQSPAEVEAGAEGEASAEPMGADGEMQAFSLDPVVVNIASQDLAQGLNVSASTAAAIEANSGGGAAVDLTAVGVLTEEGRLAALIEGAAPAGGLNGSATLTDLSAALLQPIVDALGQPIDVEADFGPVVSLSLTASAAGDVTAEEMPPTRLELVASAEHATLGGTLALEQGVLRTVRESNEGAGLTAHLAAAGPLARRLGGEALASRLQGQMPLEVQVTDLVLPLSAEARMRDLVANVTVIASGAALGLAAGDAAEGGQGQSAAPVQVQQMRLTGAVSPGSPARVEVDSRLAHGERPFLLRGQVDLTGAQGAAAIQEAMQIKGPGVIERLRPSGQVMVTGVPSSVLDALGLGAGESEGVAREVMLALSDALGQSADASITFEPGAADRAPLVIARASGEQAGVDVSVSAREGAVAIREATAQLTVSAERGSALLAAMTGGKEPSQGDGSDRQQGEQQPAQTEPVRPIAVVGADVPLTATISPITIPMEGWRPRSGTDAKAVIAVTTGGPIRLEQIRGRVQDVTLQVADAQAELTAPFARLLPADDAEGEQAPAAETAPIQAALSAGLQDGQGEPIAAIQGGATLAQDRKLEQARLVVDQIDTFRIDDMLGAKGSVSGLLGETATVRAALTPRSETLSTVDMEILAPNVSGAAMTLEATGQQVSLTEPANITWIVQPAAANHLLGMGGAEAGALVEPVTARIDVDSFSMAVPGRDAQSGAERGPLSPDLFALGASVELETLVMRATETELATLSGIHASVASDPQPGVVNFEMTVAGVTGEQGAGEGASAIRGTVSNLADARGVPTPEQISIDAQGALSQIPTALIDAIANQDGLLLAALGPAASMRIDAVGLTRDSGQLSAALRSERADASVAGYIEEARFITTAPMQVRLTEVHPELVAALSGSLPVISTLEKTPSHAPGLIRAEDMQIPIDGDVSRLNGLITVDLGEVDFATRPVFGEFIKALGGHQQGTIGRSIDPFTVRITDGVLEYQRYKLPIGEFSIETEGRVDLVNRTMDVVTYVPLFALSDEAAGLFNTSLAGRVPMLDNATLVPLRTSGVIGSTNTQLDMEQFLRQRGRDLRDLPGNVIDGIGDILNTGRRGNGNKDGGEGGGD